MMKVECGQCLSLIFFSVEMVSEKYDTKVCTENLTLPVC